MKRILSAMVGVVLAGVMPVQAEGTVEAGPVSVSVGTAAKPVRMQTICPVMKGKINRKLYVDYDGKRIYACCGGCLDTLKKDAAKIAKAVEAEGITLEKTPVTPPAVEKKP